MIPIYSTTVLYDYVCLLSLAKVNEVFYIQSTAASEIGKEWHSRCGQETITARGNAE